MLTYILCLVVALIIHELGHLVAARACSVPVSEFGLGWGRQIFGFERGGVEYKLHALPVGAYVRLNMEELQRRPLSQQALVLLAGVIVNLLAAVMAGAERVAMREFVVGGSDTFSAFPAEGGGGGGGLLGAPS